MPPKTITMLSRVQTAELTLCRRGANNRRFAVSKSLENPMKIANAVLSTPVEGEAQLVATLKSRGASEQRIEAAVAALRIQKGFADVVEDEDRDLVEKSLVTKAKKSDDEEEDEDDDKPAFLKEKAKKEKAKKSLGLEDLEPEIREQITAVFKSRDDLEKKSAKLEEVVKSLVDEKTTTGFIAKAKDSFGHVPMPVADLAQLLKTAHGVSPEHGASMEKLLGQFNEVVQKSSMFANVGSSGPGRGDGSAMAKLEELAAGIVQKSAGEMTREKAMDTVLKTAEGRALYKQYLTENPAQRAKHNY